MSLTIELITISLLFVSVMISIIGIVIIALYTFVTYKMFVKQSEMLEVEKNKLELNNQLPIIIKNKDKEPISNDRKNKGKHKGQMYEYEYDIIVATDEKIKTIEVIINDKIITYGEIKYMDNGTTLLFSIKSANIDVKDIKKITLKYGHRYKNLLIS